jgi:hypothetical protein
MRFKGDWRRLAYPEPIGQINKQGVEKDTIAAKSTPMFSFKRTAMVAYKTQKYPPDVLDGYPIASIDIETTIT